jgi:hypothetical protein
MMHGFLEGPAPAAVIVRDFGERGPSEQWWNVVKQPACEHCRGEIAPVVVGRVQFFAK